MPPKAKLMISTMPGIQAIPGTIGCVKSLTVSFWQPILCSFFFALCLLGKRLWTDGRNKFEQLNGFRPRENAWWYELRKQTNDLAFEEWLSVCVAIPSMQKAIPINIWVVAKLAQIFSKKKHHCISAQGKIYTSASKSEFTSSTSSRLLYVYTIFIYIYIIYNYVAINFKTLMSSVFAVPTHITINSMISPFSSTLSSTACGLFKPSAAREIRFRRSGQRFGFPSFGKNAKKWSKW